MGDRSTLYAMMADTWFQETGQPWAPHWELPETTYVLPSDDSRRPALPSMALERWGAHHTAVGIPGVGVEQVHFVDLFHPLSHVEPMGPTKPVTQTDYKLATRMGLGVYDHTLSHGAAFSCIGPWSAGYFAAGRDIHDDHSRLPYKTIRDHYLRNGCRYQVGISALGRSHWVPTIGPGSHWWYADRDDALRCYIELLLAGEVLVRKEWGYHELLATDPEICRHFGLLNALEYFDFDEGAAIAEEMGFVMDGLSLSERRRWKTTHVIPTDEDDER